MSKTRSDRTARVGLAGWRRRVLAASAALAALSTIAAGAAGPVKAAASPVRLDVIDVPSAGNIDLAISRLNGSTKSLRASIMLPAGYDEQPDRRWPVLYLLHGVDDSHSTWSDARYGDILRRAAKLDAVVVMPEGGRGYYTNQWRGGSRRGANWERYLLTEVIPTVERRYRIAPGRQNHAISGISMGGYGAVLLAAQLPSYFGAAVAQSGIFDLSDPLTQHIVPLFSKFNFVRQWGTPGGPYAQAHDPMRLLPNLRRTRLLVSTGNGTIDLRRPFDLTHATIGAAIEWGSWWQSHRFAHAARRGGVPVQLSAWTGVHDWVYWRRDLDRVFRWGVLGTDAMATGGDGASFTYRTMAPAGNAWGLGFRFSEPPRRVLTLQRAGDVVKATGTGTLTLTPGAADADASGGGALTNCAFTSELPFEYRLPATCTASE